MSLQADETDDALVQAFLHDVSAILSTVRRHEGVPQAVQVPRPVRRYLRRCAQLGSCQVSHAPTGSGRLAHRSRMTGALAEWTGTYPGDLEDDTTQACVREILAIILRHVSLASLAADLSLVEANMFEARDVDRTWALKIPGAGSSRPVTPRSVSGSSIRLARHGSRARRSGDSPTSTPGGTRPNSVAFLRITRASRPRLQREPSLVDEPKSTQL